MVLRSQMSAVFQGVPIVLAGVTWSTTPNPALPSGHVWSSNSGLIQPSGGVSVVYRHVSAPSVALRSRIRGSADEAEAGPHAKHRCQPDHPNSRQLHFSLYGRLPSKILVHVPPATPVAFRIRSGKPLCQRATLAGRLHRRPTAEELAGSKSNPRMVSCEETWRRRTCLTTCDST